jgi:hypothetical protein
MVPHVCLSVCLSSFLLSVGIGQDLRYKRDCEDARIHVLISVLKTALKETQLKPTMNYCFNKTVVSNSFFFVTEIKTFPNINRYELRLFYIALGLPTFEN